LVGRVVGALDRAVGPPLLHRGDLLNDVLDKDVHEQRPLPGLADFKRPAVRRLELGIGDLVLTERGVDPDRMALTTGDTRSGLADRDRMAKDLHRVNRGEPPRCWDWVRVESPRVLLKMLVDIEASARPPTTGATTQ
jgi:hypothetical protein